MLLFLVLTFGGGGFALSPLAMPLPPPRCLGGDRSGDLPATATAVAVGKVSVVVVGDPSLSLSRAGVCGAMCGAVCGDVLFWKDTRLFD
jgi:hypothetical protein